MGRAEKEQITIQSKGLKEVNQNKNSIAKYEKLSKEENIFL